VGAVGFAGRRSELRVLTNTLSGDGPTALLVVGEAGVGKSRLIAAAADATRMGVAVLVGSCLPLSGGRPFLPVVDVLRGMAEADDEQLLKAALADCPVFVRTDLARLLPELGDASSPAMSAVSDEWQQNRLLDALRQVLRAAASLTRVAVVIEDVHWADRSTLELLDYLLAPGHETGAPIVITSRSEEEPATGWLERAQRNSRIERLDLPPLTRAETAEQIELLTGSRPTSAFVDETYSRTEGNAFFTEQLVSAGGELPSGLVSLLLSRTAQTAGPAGELLESLAVAAQPLDEQTLLQLCGRSASEVRPAMRDLLDRRLLRAPDASGRHQLRHALLGEAISNDMLPQARRDLHLRIARVMADRDDNALAAQIAEHVAAAGRPDEELRWRVIAAEQADSVFAATEASAHWQRVLELWDDTADPGIDLAEVYLRAALSTEGAGHQARAGALGEEAVARIGVTAEPATLVGLYCTVGRYRGVESVEAGLAALGTAIGVGEQLPPSPEYVQALMHYAHLLAAQGRVEEERAAVRTALRTVRQLDDPSDEKVLLMQRAFLALRAGDRADADRALQRAARLVLADPSVETLVAVIRTDLLAESGDLEGAVEFGLRALGRPDMVGRANWFAMHMIRMNVCEALIELGDVERAAALIDPVTVSELNWDTGYAHLARADLDVLRGRLADAARRWGSIADFVEVQFDKSGIPVCRARRLELGLWLGDFDEPLAEALATLNDIGGTHLNDFAAELFATAMRAHAELAELARAAGDGQRLPDIVASAARLDEVRAGAKVDPFAARLLPVTCPAYGLLYKAERTRVHNEPDPHAWERARVAWDALARPHRAAYAGWRQAEALVARRGGKESAIPVLRAAAGQATQHVPLSAAIHDLARRARIDLSKPGQVVQHEEPRPRPPFGLTERELAVLQLLSDGKTNSEIGAALYISRKTASVHVTNILRKLDVTTRVQAGTVAERAGLLARSGDSGRHR
jgi:DNA-binding CsgD family transcriptional regulator/tetratricopeptide (TPR) repeat protein